jgi:hypothetical protein
LLPECGVSGGIKRSAIVDLNPTYNGNAGGELKSQENKNGPPDHPGEPFNQSNHPTTFEEITKSVMCKPIFM